MQFGRPEAESERRGKTWRGHRGGVDGGQPRRPHVQPAARYIKSSCAGLPVYQVTSHRHVPSRVQRNAAPRDLFDARPIGHTRGGGIPIDAVHPLSIRAPPPVLPSSQLELRRVHRARSAELRLAPSSKGWVRALAPDNRLPRAPSPARLRAARPPHPARRVHHPPSCLLIPTPHHADAPLSLCPQSLRTRRSTTQCLKKRTPKKQKCAAAPRLERCTARPALPGDAAPGRRRARGNRRPPHHHLSSLCRKKKHNHERIRHRFPLRR